MPGYGDYNLTSFRNQFEKQARSLRDEFEIVFGIILKNPNKDMKEECSISLHRGISNLEQIQDSFYEHLEKFEKQNRENLDLRDQNVKLKENILDLKSNKLEPETPSRINHLMSVLEEKNHKISELQQEIKDFKIQNQVFTNF